MIVDVERVVTLAKAVAALQVEARVLGVDGVANYLETAANELLYVIGRAQKSEAETTTEVS